MLVMGESPSPSNNSGSGDSLGPSYFINLQLQGRLECAVRRDIHSPFQLLFDVEVLVVCVCVGVGG